MLNQEHCLFFGRLLQRKSQLLREEGGRLPEGVCHVELESRIQEFRVQDGRRLLEDSRSRARLSSCQILIEVICILTNIRM